MNNQRQRNIQNIVDRIAINARTTTMKSEHTANLSLVADTEQNHLPQHEVAAANRAARQRRHENNMRFWHSVKSLVLVITLAAIAIRVLIHFAGKV